MTAALTLYLVNIVSPRTTEGALQVDNFFLFGTGGPPSTATMTTTGWQPGAVTLVTNESSDLSYASIQGSGTFSSTLGPTAGVGATQAFGSETPLWGIFDRGPRVAPRSPAHRARYARHPSASFLAYQLLLFLTMESYAAMPIPRVQLRIHHEYL